MHEGDALTKADQRCCINSRDKRADEQAGGVELDSTSTHRPVVASQESGGRSAAAEADTPPTATSGYPGSL